MVRISGERSIGKRSIGEQGVAGLPEIRFYLHKEFRDRQIRFYLHKELRGAMLMKIVILLRENESHMAKNFLKHTIDFS